MSKSAAAAEAVQEDPKPETFLKTLMVDVTSEEQAQRKDRLVAVDRLIIDTEAEKASANSDFNDQIKQLKKERVQLLASIACQREGREVACYLERDDRLGEMRTKRADTGEVIDVRPLTIEERQTEMFGQPAPEGSDSAPESGEAAAGGTETADDVQKAIDEAGDQPAGEATQTGRVRRIRASDVKKKKAEREAKARQAVESNGAGEDEDGGAA